MAASHLLCIKITSVFKQASEVLSSLLQEWTGGLPSFIIVLQRNGHLLRPLLFDALLDGVSSYKSPESLFVLKQHTSLCSYHVIIPNASPRNVVPLLQ